MPAPAGTPGPTSPDPLHWPDCLNVRDVGGTPLAPGGFVKPGALIRSDHLGRLTTEGRAAVRALGPSLIMDLREEQECGRDPNPFAGDGAYRHQPFEDPADPTRPGGTLAQSYTGTLDRYPRFVGAAVRAVAEAPPGPVVVHCHAGKDRTGLLVALVLLLVGADEEVVTEEYARSHDALRPRYDPVLATITDEQEYAARADRMSARPATMRAALTHLRERHAGARAYLSAAGVDGDHLDALRRRLVAG